MLLRFVSIVRHCLLNFSIRFSSSPGRRLRFSSIVNVSFDLIDSLSSSSPSCLSLHLFTIRSSSSTECTERSDVLSEFLQIDSRLLPTFDCCISCFIISLFIIIFSFELLFLILVFGDACGCFISFLFVVVVVFRSDKLCDLSFTQFVVGVVGFLESLNEMVDDELKLSDCLVPFN